MGMGREQGRGGRLVSGARGLGGPVLRRRSDALCRVDAQRVAIALGGLGVVGVRSVDQPEDVPADVAADVVAQRELCELVRLGLAVAAHHVADEALHRESLAVRRRGSQDLVRDAQALLVLARLVQAHDLAEELVAIGE